ncbi:MAG: hypothetical protein IPI73_13380 [Betaproteobacteria bacterium]|nr:hypothetical protein [Betaproteobacteria bacterium]
MRDSKRISGSSMRRIAAAWLGSVLIGLAASAAQSQIITEFTAGITANAPPDGITAGPDGTGRARRHPHWRNRARRPPPP